MSNIIKIESGKLAKRRNRNAWVICKWVQRGIIPPRKEMVLKSILATLRQGNI